MIKRLHNFLLHTSRIKFAISVIFLSLTVKFIVGLLVMLISMDIDVLNNPKMEEDISTFKIFLEVVLLTPLLETLIFQMLLIVVPLKYIVKRNKTNYIIFGLLSALLLGIAHCYNIYYIFFALSIGLYFSYITIMTAFLREKKVSVWITVCGAHLFINLTAFLTLKLF